MANGAGIGLAFAASFMATTPTGFDSADTERNIMNNWTYNGQPVA